MRFTLSGRNKSVKRSSGLTLIEILVTMIILAIMASSATMFYSDVMQQTNRDKALSDLKQICKVLADYDSTFPEGITTYTQISINPDQRDLEKLVEARKMVTIPRDPWGNFYRIDIQAGIVYSQGMDIARSFDYYRYTTDATHFPPLPLSVEDSIKMAQDDDVIVRFRPQFKPIRADMSVTERTGKEVSIINVPAFLYKRDQKVTMEKYGEITFDISFGGSFFAIVKAAQFGLKIIPDNANALKEIGLELRDIINRDIEIQHPTLEHIKTVDLVEFYDDAVNPEANFRNVVVFGQGQVDRSPCGTGTSAKLATLYTKGELKEGEEFIYESILGTMFKGEIVGTGKIGDFVTITPKITGAAYITGFNHFVIDEDDPVKHGFVLK